MIGLRGHLRFACWSLLFILSTLTALVAGLTISANPGRVIFGGLFRKPLSPPDRLYRGGNVIGCLAGPDETSCLEIAGEQKQKFWAHECDERLTQPRSEYWRLMELFAEADGGKAFWVECLEIAGVASNKITLPVKSIPSEWQKAWNGKEEAERQQIRTRMAVRVWWWWFQWSLVPIAALAVSAVAALVALRVVVQGFFFDRREVERQREDRHG